ncbi:MAG: hypothetical protein ACYTEQ_09375 [Planctomycetota bacterium]|jgi:hypothetical protein
MTKRKRARGAKDKGYEEFTLLSGVKIRALPIPPLLPDQYREELAEEYPDPEPPDKEITVLGGSETVPNLEDEDYQAELEAAKATRRAELASMLLKYALDFCVEVVNPKKWEPTIKRLEKHSRKPFPKDEHERRVQFLSTFAFRTAQEFNLLVNSVTSQAAITGAEVESRMNSFPSDLEGSAASRDEASSPDEGERVAVE